MTIVRRKRKKNKRNRREAANFRRKVRKARKKAARIKAVRERHRKCHPKNKTKYGVFAIIARYMVEHLKIRELIARIFTGRKGRNSKFSAVDMIVGILGMIILGMARLYYISEEYQEENILGEQLGMPEIFSGDTAYRFIKTFGMPLYSWQLQEINGQLVRKRLRMDKQIIADGDWTTLRSYENNKEGAEAGYNKLRPGQPCYQASQFFANGYGINTELVGGKTMPKGRPFLEKSLGRVRYLIGRIDWFRADSAYCNHENLCMLDQFTCTAKGSKKIQFVLSSAVSSKGARHAFRLAQNRTWQELSRGVYIMEFPSIQVYAGYSAQHRMIIVKRYFEARNCWDTYALVTNNTDMSALQVFYFYHQRQTLESFFKETKHSYYLENLPGSKLRHNHFYLQLICLAFNMIRMARLDLFCKNDHALFLNTLRRQYLHLDVEFYNGILFIPRWYPKYRTIVAIVQRLLRLNIPFQYRIVG